MTVNLDSRPASSEREGFAHVAEASSGRVVERFIDWRGKGARRRLQRQRAGGFERAIGQTATQACADS